MKKTVLVFISIMLIILFSTSVFAVKTYDYSGDLPEYDEAYFEPQILDHNATLYAPWFVQYARSTKTAYEKGIRAGDGNQRIMSIGISPINPNLMLIGSDKSGLLRSKDAGQNWELVGGNNNGWGCTDIEWSPFEEKTAFCMQTGNIGNSNNSIDKANASTLHGIYKTVDAGKTWYQVLSSKCLSNANTKAIRYMPSGNLYVLTNNGLYKSVDDGESYELISEVLPENSFIGTLEISTDEKTMLASGDGGVYYSNDGGKSWSLVNGNLTEANYSTCVRFDPADESHWYACFDYLDNYSNLFETYDYGVTWKRMYMKNNAESVRNINYIEFSKGLDGKDILIALYSRWGAVYWYSEDKGKSWKQNTFDRVDEDIYACGNGYAAEGIAVLATNPSVVYYSFGDNIYKSTDGGKSYKWSNSGFSGINTNCVYFDKENYMWFCDVDRGLAVTDVPYAGGTYPTVSRTGPKAQSQGVAVDPNNSNHVFSSIDTKLYETFDRGATWNIVEGVSPDAVVKYHDKDSNVIYTSGSTSRDGGKTWIPNEKTIVAVSNVDNDIVYSYESKVLYRSTDRGITWEIFCKNIMASYVFYPDEFDKDTVWYGGYNGNVYKIVNGKQTSYTSANGLKSDKGLVSVQAIAQDPKDKNHLVMGGKNTREGVKTPGIYETYDGGETWVLVPGAKGTFIVNSIRFSPISDEVFIGTCSNGFYVYDYKTFKKWYDCELITFASSDNGTEYILTEKLKPGKFKARTTVKNNYAVPVLGLYDKNNPSKLIRFVTGKSTEQGENTSVEAEIEILEKDVKEGILKFFVWDALEDGRSLKKVAEIK